MSRRIVGTLTGATGEPIPHLPLRLVAVVSTPPSVPRGHVVEFRADAAGAYDVTLMPGRYQVTARYGEIGDQPRVLGHITVTAGPDVDLLTLLAESE